MFLEEHYINIITRYRGKKAYFSAFYHIQKCIYCKCKCSRRMQMRYANVMLVEQVPLCILFSGNDKTYCNIELTVKAVNNTLCDRGVVNKFFVWSVTTLPSTVSQSLIVPVFTYIRFERDHLSKLYRRSMYIFIYILINVSAANSAHKK